MPVQIIPEECIACSACEAECGKGAIFHNDLHFAVHPHYCDCEDCVCVEVCPSGAIVPLAVAESDRLHKSKTVYYRNTGAL